VSPLVPKVVPVRYVSRRSKSVKLPELIIYLKRLLSLFAHNENVLVLFDNIDVGAGVLSPDPLPSKNATVP